MHDVHTRIRLELLPCFTRTRWMFGSQRRLDRLCEKLTCFPTHGSLHADQQQSSVTIQVGADLELTSPEGGTIIDAEQFRHEGSGKAPGNLTPNQNHIGAERPSHG